MNLLKGLIFFTTLFALSRIIPHPPNFTPLISGAIFLPYLLQDRRLVMLLPVVTMFVADIFLGFHGLMIWTYGAFLMIGLLSFNYFKFKPTSIFILSVLSPSVFFLITNFGVWLDSEFYSQSLEGLIASYIMGLPFYANSLTSTVLFSASFYAVISAAPTLRFLKKR